MKPLQPGLLVRTIADAFGRRLYVERDDTHGVLRLSIAGQMVYLNATAWDDLCQCIAFPPLVPLNPEPKIKKPLRTQRLKGGRS